MKLMSFEVASRQSWGVVERDAVLDLADASAPTLRRALANGGLREISRRKERAAARIPLSSVRFLQPITDPEKILCVGVNYRKHAEEAGMAVPKYPSIFSRFPGSQVGHGVPVWRPRASDQFDYEAELAVVIGTRVRNAPHSEALRYVAGYSCFAENSVRDFQKHATQATPGKNFQASGAFGPWLVTPDEAGNPEAMEVIGKLNGEELQRDSTANMIFTVPQLIAYVSSWTELLPGDVIVTGTPAGVGFTKKPPLYMKDGDVFEVEIPLVGVLRNPVIEEPGRG
jgi:2-keto-4-pentenoate hydratase/2-oxohepta-3-ene-1,7-dioic acid hydratase in catechol pathway